jgi:hypothetical protein
MHPVSLVPLPQNTRVWYARVDLACLGGRLMYLRRQDDGCRVDGWMDGSNSNNCFEQIPSYPEWPCCCSALWGLYKNNIHLRSYVRVRPAEEFSLLGMRAILLSGLSCCSPWGGGSSSIPQKDSSCTFVGMHVRKLLKSSRPLVCKHNPADNLGLLWGSALRCHSVLLRCSLKSSSSSQAFC